MDATILDFVFVGGLLIVGLILVLLELFFIPGVSFSALGALLCYIGAVSYAFETFGASGGYLVLGISLLITGGAVVWFIRSKSIDKMALKTNIEGVAPTQIDNRIAVGDRGVALSRLNPMGTVLIQGITAEAKIRSGFLDEGTPIVVREVGATTLIVERV